jgi:phenylacetic acid degradation operon negative regulatory protein
VTVVPQAVSRAAERGAQPRQLIVTVYGLYSRADGGWMSVASLITLLADLGVDEPAVRSSIARLKRRGILHASRRGAAGYELSAEGLAILAEGDHRIFRRERASLADGWLLAVFSVPEAERHKRHVLRSQLARLGFGTAAPGVWIAPAHLHDATAGMLRRLGLDSYADLFRVHHTAFDDLAVKVRQWWDLGQLERLYQRFLAANGPVLRRWQSGPAEGGSAGRLRAHLASAGVPPAVGEGGFAGDVTGTGGQGGGGGAAPAPGGEGGCAGHVPPVGEAFGDYVRVLTDWRQLPYSDPGLPAELLPADWIGMRAADLFFTLRALLEEPARAHASRVLGAHDVHGVPCPR